MIDSVCPGARKLIQPQIVMRSCPDCSEEVEFFEYEIELKCPSCGKTVKKEMENSCILWCEYAEKCLTDIETRGLMPKERLDDLKSITAKKQDLTKKQ